MDNILCVENIQELQCALNKYDIQLSEDQLNKLLTHLDLVIKKNEEINLTRILNTKDALYLHIIDSLLLTLLPIKYTGKFLDIGTGAGFPGLPFGIATNLDGVLLDSTNKKIKAVNEFIDILECNNKLQGVHARVEEFAQSHKNEFDIVLARAVAQSNILIEYAAPLQKMGGYLVLAKARIQNDEYNTALKAAEICGYENVSRETFELAYELGHREILIFKKVKKESLNLPRNNGIAKQHPLGL